MNGPAFSTAVSLACIDASVIPAAIRKHGAHVVVDTLDDLEQIAWHFRADLAGSVGNEQVRVHVGGHRVTFTVASEVAA